MGNVIVLDTNIFYNMLNSKDCYLEMINLLKDYEIGITDLTIYELNNKHLNLNKLFNNDKIQLYRIKCMGKGLSFEESQELRTDIVNKGVISRKLLIKMKNLYSYMIKPIICIWLMGYINIFCSQLKIDKMKQIREDVYSNKNFKKISRNVQNILCETNPKKFKNKFYCKIKRFWKYYLYKYGVNDDREFLNIKRLINKDRINQIFNIDLGEKSNNEILRLFENDFDNKEFPIIKKHYNSIIANYFKVLYMSCITSQAVIEINHLIDTLIMSILQYDVILCTDDKKMNNFLIFHNRFNKICDKVIEVKEKYDMVI